MRSWSWWRFRVLELTLALFLAFLVIQVSNMVGQRQKLLLPPTAWFLVHEINVPDHESGSDPTLVYDREVRAEFTGFWIVEVQRLMEDGLFFNECSGFGTNFYAPTQIIEHDRVNWQWMVGRPCPVGPGQYRLRATWTMKNPGWPEKNYQAISNVFSVTEGN